VDNDNWEKLTIQLPTSMQNFSGYYDETTELLHIIHGHPSNHDYIAWSRSKRSRNYGMVTPLPQWIPLFSTGTPPPTPIHSFVVDM
jgi:hypothetical protein